MLSYLKKQINNAKLHLEPYPYFVINNLLPEKKLKNLNKILPSFKDLDGREVLYQSSSRTKKTILPSSIIYKKLKKKKIFNEIDLLLKKIQFYVIKKFKKEIKKNISSNFINSKIIYHSSYSTMKKGYLKSPHLDRRDHLVHGIFYPFSDHSKGGDIQICKLKKKKKLYDVFPDKKDLSISKKYKVKNNFCIFILNVPWSYHSVSKYNSSKDRKYFYLAYDFDVLSKGSIKKNRKKGFNANDFWVKKVKVNSKKRKKTFLSE
jgi:hypothetical protein